MAFIVFEGMDRCGKTTQAQALAAALNVAEAGSAIYLREPGGRAVGEKLRNILLENPMPRDSQLLLFFASRLVLVHEVIVPALADGKTIVLDRWIPSTWAYQVRNTEDQWLVEAILDLRDRVESLAPPDYIIWLDASLEELTKRREADKTVFETAEFQSGLYEAYRTWFNNYETNKCAHVFGGTVPEVKVAIKNVLAKAFPELTMEHY